MKFVYLAHPFISNPKFNIQRINEIAKIIVHVQMKQVGTVEHIPLVPHNLLSVFSEEQNPNLRPITEEVSQRLIAFADELWLCSSVISKGMTLEIEAAKRKRIPIISYQDLLRSFKFPKDLA